MNDQLLQERAQSRRRSPDRLSHLLRDRMYLSELRSHLRCWGMLDLTSVDRDIALVEKCVLDLSRDKEVTERLLAQWREQDAADAHQRGLPRPGHDCAVCSNGALSLEDLFGLYETSRT